MRDGYTGKTVVDGEVRFWSVSAMEKADPRAHGCNLKWLREKVLGEKPPVSEKNQASMDAGTKLHDDIVAYLTTGTHAIDPLIIKGAHFMPPPGSPVTLEKGFHTITFPNFVTALPDISSPLTAAGKPFVGYIDCAHSLGVNYGAEDPSEMYDPPRTVEVIDWKRKGNAYDKRKNPLWKRPEELLYTIQMSGYGELIRRTTPGVEHIRLSHGNFFEKGSAPRKITKLHTVDEIERSWQYSEALGRTLIDVAREPDIQKVPPNVKACDAFGGCAFRDSCHAYKNNSLDKLYSDNGASTIAKDFENHMSLLGTIPMNPPAAGQPAPAAPVNYAAIPQAPTPAADPRASLLAEEAALRAAQPGQQAMPSSLLDAWQCILSHGRGMPALSNEAAQAFAQANKWQFSGGGYAGAGQLAGVMLQTSANIYVIANELEESVGRPPRFTVPIAAPASQPIPVVAAPVVATPPAAPIAPPPSHPVAGGLLPPGAPPSIPMLAAANPPGLPAPQAPAEAPAEEPKRTRGRPKKQDPNPHLAQIPVPGAAPTAPTAATMAAPGVPPAGFAPTPPFAASQAVQPSPSATAVGAVSTSPSSAGYRVFINCRPEFPTVNLAEYVEYLNATLARMYCTDNQGRPTIQDVRAAPKDSPLAYNGWRGGVRDVTISQPPPAGDYHLDVFGDDLKEVVADAMRTVCQKHDGLYVRSLGGR